MLIQILQHINDFNEFIFSPVDNIISKLPFEDWALDAIQDSIHLLPLLFIIFLIIEALEFYYSEKIDERIKHARKSSVIIGALASILPQCGFSVIASSLYSRKKITRGCLIAVYLGTSDETIPILLANPTKAYLIVPIVALKFFIAIFMGYIIDLFAGQGLWNKRYRNREDLKEVHEHDENEHEHCHEIIEGGCCNHSPNSTNKRELILHPLYHTFNIFMFILVITFILNYILSNVSLVSMIEKTSTSYLQPVITAFIGLIPNCAVSIAITMMLIKGTITFGSAMSGLLSNAGLGLLVLLKNNSIKDTFKTIILLLLISITAGIIIQIT